MELDPVVAPFIMSRPITLQITVGERVIEEIRTITGIPGYGGNNDLISVRLALELGCRIKPSKFGQYRLEEKDLEVVWISRLKLHLLGPFGRDPLKHWVDVSVIVIHNLHSVSVYGRDMLLSWPTQNQLRIPNSQHLNQQRLLHNLEWRQERSSSGSSVASAFQRWKLH